MTASAEKTTAPGDSLAPVAGESSSELQEQLAFLGYLTAEQRLHLPDWLVIAPPKTGTSWLYANLREHSQVFAPAIKELKYFSHRFESEDLRAYLDHFHEGFGKSKGEVSPSYSMLPQRTIRLIRRLMPDLKLIYLMRDPIERAWSHARHSFRQGEANFKGRLGSIDEVSDDEWIANFSDDWNRLSSDYLGQLQRWLSVFPREQVFVRFFEDLARSPRTFLREVLEFLGVDPAFADSSDINLDAVNVGISKEPSPRLTRHLRSMYSERTAELAAYANREFQLQLPVEWEHSFGRPFRPKTADATEDRSGEASPIHTPSVDLTWEAEDDTLARLLARDDLLAMDFLGFNLVRRGTTFMAYRITLGVERPEDFDSSWWQDQAARGNCHFADNPHDLKSMIVRQMVSREAPPGSQLARLHELELQVDHLARQQAGADVRLTDLKQDMANSVAPLDLLSRRQAGTEAQLTAFEQAVSRGLEPLDALSRRLETISCRQGESEAHFAEWKQLVALRLAPLDSLRENQARLEEELARCASQLARCAGQLSDVQKQLRGAQLRLKKLSRNRVLRALRWLEFFLPIRRAPGRGVPQTGPQMVGCLIVRAESPPASSDDKHLLPSVERCAISPANRRKPSASPALK